MPSEMDRRQEMQRTMTLSEQLSKPDPAIRDFLKIPHDDGDAERRPSTLMDAISRDGPTAADSAGGGMINWKPLRDRLRLLRAASAWVPSPSTKPATVNITGTLSDSKSGSHRSNKYNYSPGEAAAAFSRTFSRAPSLRATPTFSRASSTRVGHTSESTSTRRAVADDEEEEEEEEDDDEDDNEEEGEDEAPAAQMSLMALLEQTDSQWDEEEEEEDGAGAGAHGARKNAAGLDEDDGEGREEEMVHVCCVCMVRHKGAAFIPCGHTFCRLCSRELWVSRGNCPLCNGFIQEILDIF